MRRRSIALRPADIRDSLGIASPAVQHRGRTPIRRRWPVVGATALLWVSLGAGCGGDGAASAAACGPARRQQAQSDSVVHVLPGQTSGTYLSDPPTSGPHTALPRGVTVYREPLAKPAQVGILERGDVLVQYRPADLQPADIAGLEALAGPPEGPGAIVAPNPDLPEPVVASAWLYLRSCTRLDVDAIGEFVAERAGKGPTSH